MQNLDRDLAVEPGISRAINLTHAARAKGRKDLVLVENRTSAEGHLPDYTFLNKHPEAGSDSRSGNFAIVRKEGFTGSNQRRK